MLKENTFSMHHIIKNIAHTEVHVDLSDKSRLFRCVTGLVAVVKSIHFK